MKNLFENFRMVPKSGETDKKPVIVSDDGEKMSSAKESKLKENLEEDSLQSYEINLSVNKDGGMDESFLRMFGGAVQSILGRMFGGSQIPVKIRGTKSEVQSFAKAIEGEKRYMKSFRQYGLDDPRTYRNKAELEKAVSSFERKTGINWPFK